MRCKWLLLDALFWPKKIRLSMVLVRVICSCTAVSFFGTEFPYKGIQKERSRLRRLRKVRLLDGSSFERKVDGEALLPITTHDSGMS